MSVPDPTRQLVAGQYERAVEVLDYHQHGSERCATVVIAGDSYGDDLGDQELCIELAELRMVSR
ncbi:hypothetical protein [Rhodococcus sp. A5(2022)]|uniref:hypothetical protein n=1 Tax=Rhodococcus sp. A5(2022) TaxID=3003588 RepID=UPI0022A83642|nr:hypothetical protein [Rhodococcus sp. A5(2022)]MCZ1075050.1 hypothetical protein [Rhodococcus sp. A5(2022)]